MQRRFLHRLAVQNIRTSVRRPTQSFQHAKISTGHLQRSMSSTDQVSTTQTASQANTRHTSDNATSSLEEGKQITIQVRKEAKDGPVTQYTIRRSFPTATPTKLVQGLERLLSCPAHWKLTRAGTGIYTTYLIGDQKSSDELVSKINETADSLNHHPHLSVAQSPSGDGTVVGVLCTTHQPAGLSLKDVKLADAIDLIVRDLDAVHHIERHELVVVLLDRNIAEAEDAVQNPNTRCNLRGKASST